MLSRRHCDGDRSVQVAQWDEVGVLGEAVDNGQNHGLVVYAREVLDEVHGDVGPHHTRQHRGCSNHVCWRCSDLLRW
jgi:hypothetical protein